MENTMKSMVPEATLVCDAWLVCGAWFVMHATTVKEQVIFCSNGDYFCTLARTSA